MACILLTQPDDPLFHLGGDRVRAGRGSPGPWLVDRLASGLESLDQLVYPGFGPAPAPTDTANMMVLKARPRAVGTSAPS